MSFNAGTAIAYLELDTSKFKQGFSNANRDLQTFSSGTASTRDKLTGLSGAMGSVGSSLTKGLTLPIVGAGAAMVKTAAEFESGMSEVGAISGASAGDMEKLSAKAQEMGATTKFSATESAEAMKYMAMAGWKTEDMLGGVSGIMNLAAASGEDLATTSDIVTDALTAFGMKASDSGHFADILAAASSNANTNVSMMGETFKYVAPIAGTLGYSAEDTAIAIGIMANSGIKASQAGTVLRTGMTNLAHATSDKAAAAMEELGISIQNSDGSVKSFKEVMDMLRSTMGGTSVDVTDASGNLLSYDDMISKVSKSTDGLSKVQQIEAASTIFGKEAMSGMLSIINASDEDYQKLTESIYNCDGTAQNMADAMNDNLIGQLTLLKSGVEGVSIAFGNIMLPVITDIVKWLQSVVEKINGLSDGAKQIIMVIATVLAAVGPVLLIGSKIITGFLTLSSLLTSIGSSMTALLGPVALLVAAAGLLVAAWVTNFAGFRDHVKNIFSAIFEIIKAIIDNIKFAWETNWLNMQGTVQLVLEVIRTVIDTAFKVIEGLVKVFSGVIKGDWKQVWNGVKQVASSIWEGIKKLFKAFLNWIVNTLLNIGARLWVAAKSAFEKIKKGFSEKWNAIKSWFSKAKEDPVTAIKSIGSSLFNAGKNAFNKLLEGFKSVWGTIKGWFDSVGKWISEKLQFWKKSVSDAEKAQSKASKGASSAGGGKSSGGKKKMVGEFAKGLDYVPYDGFPAILHKGERVLTKKEAAAYNSGSGAGSNTYEFNFYSPTELSPAEQSRRFKKTMDRILFSM